MNDDNTAGANSPEHSAPVEHAHHDYVGNAIPWYVRAMWIGFWIFAVVYTFRYVFPALQAELFNAR
jgi:hypothetical protein